MRAEGTIETYTGRYVNPLALTADEIDPIDIANALSRQCRYNGHTNGHLSVARHSIWVSQWLREEYCSRDTQLWGLLHDAAETYLGDLVRPIKHSPFGEAYLEAERRAERAIAMRFDLRFPIPYIVRQADEGVLFFELAKLRYSWDSAPRRDMLDFLALFDDLKGTR